jgi:hypothetical protein
MMTTESRTTVLTARYHHEGYISAVWETSPRVALKAFALTVTYVRQGSSGQNTLAVEDGLARAAGLPYQFEPGVQYELIVTPFDGEGFLSPSRPVPIANPLQVVAGDDRFNEAAEAGARADGGADDRYRLEFVERLPYTPLFVDSGWNVVKAKLIGPDGKPLVKQPIHWRVPPEYKGVRLEKSVPTPTDDEGVAANRIRIDRGAQVPGLLTVSAWYLPPSSATDAAAHHTAALFESVEVRVFCSFARDSAHPWTSVGTPQPDELVTATATVLDDRSRPVRGLRLAWRMHPNAASAAYEPAVHGGLRKLAWTDTPAYEQGFGVYTGELGRTTIKFANYAPQIMGVAPTVNAEEYPNHAMFSAVDLGTGQGTAVGLPLAGGVLDLDQYPDTVPVKVSPDVGVSCDAAIWLNDGFVATVYIGTAEQPGLVRVPSEYFVPGEQPNRIGDIKSGIFGNGTDSVLSRFRVRGQAHIPRPTPGGTLAEPRFDARGVRIVNDSVIAGGLAVRIPAYAAIAAGDEVRLRIYLEGYYQNTEFKRHGFYEMTHGVQASDVADGFLLVVDEAELRGYAASPKGERGRFVAQYVVAAPAGTKRYSKLLSQDMATTVADQPSEWVAFDREP